MNEELKTQVQALGLKHLAQNWDALCAAALKQKLSYHGFLNNIIAQEYGLQQETARLARIKKPASLNSLSCRPFPLTNSPNSRRNSCSNSMTPRGISPTDRN